MTWVLLGIFIFVFIIGIDTVIDKLVEIRDVLREIRGLLDPGWPADTPDEREET